MKDVLMITHFTQVPGEAGNSRFNYLANLLAAKNFHVEVVTSNFSHRMKKIRTVNEEDLKQLNYKLTTLSETGYSRNVSLKRFYSHYTFGKNLKRYLENRTKPDVIYCAVPSLDAGYVAAKYALKNQIKFIIDVQDLWPEAFKMVYNLPILSNIVFLPIDRIAEYIYSSADEIIAVSQSYVDRALKVNNKTRTGSSVFLGTDIASFDILAEENAVIKHEGEIWLAYVGTLGHSYDLITVMDALYIAKSKGYVNIKFIVMGDGPLRSYFENYATKRKLNVEFTGRLGYGELVGKLKACDIAVNPISRGAAQSIINKHADYAAAGLPVLNTQESVEYRTLVEDYHFGFNCNNSDPEDLAVKLLELCDNKALRVSMGMNSRKFAEEKMDRARTYKEIVQVITRV